MEPNLITYSLRLQCYTPCHRDAPKNKLQGSCCYYSAFLLLWHLTFMSVPDPSLKREVSFYLDISNVYETHNNN